MRAATASPTTSRSSTCSARLLATCPDPALRDGARAVTIAEKLVERELSVDHVETLAMALAEAGRFDDAIVWQRRAIERQTATGANTASSRAARALSGRPPAREPWNESVKAAAASGPPPRGERDETGRDEPSARKAAPGLGRAAALALSLDRCSQPRP